MSTPVASAPIESSLEWPKVGEEWVVNGLPLTGHKMIITSVDQDADFIEASGEGMRFDGDYVEFMECFVRTEEEAYAAIQTTLDKV